TAISLALESVYVAKAKAGMKDSGQAVSATAKSFLASAGVRESRAIGEALAASGYLQPVVDQLMLAVGPAKAWEDAFRQELEIWANAELNAGTPKPRVVNALANMFPYALAFAPEDGTRLSLVGSFKDIHHFVDGTTLPKVLAELAAKQDARNVFLNVGALDPAETASLLEALGRLSGPELLHVRVSGAASEACAQALYHGLTPLAQRIPRVEMVGVDF
ncbi:MAG: hypothetical protein ABW051_03670, partial [Burkholderiaceae bacterium]